MRRRSLLAASAASEGNNSIFPIYLNLEKVSSSEYRLDPTPESIALCDYLNENLVWNGIADWEINFKPGQLFIDGLEVQSISISGNAEIKFTNAWWYPYHSRYDEWWYLTFSIFLNDEIKPKGTMLAYNDD